MLHMQNITVSFTLAVMFVLIGSVATELRWGGRHNFTFTRHEFLVVTVKEWLKLVYFYQSYRKNKSGVPLILDHPVYRAYNAGRAYGRWLRNIIITNRVSGNKDYQYLTHVSQSITNILCIIKTKMSIFVLKH